MDNEYMIVGYYKKHFEEYSLAIPIKLGIAKYPHMLLTGSSGSGKSKALLFLIGMFLQSSANAKIYICDFKNSSDFSFLKHFPHYYAGNDCYKGIMEYYDKFSEIRSHGLVQERNLLICDEYPALINYLQIKDKQNKTRLANDVLGAVAEILMLGRGINCGIWLVMQRPQASLLLEGARDNFMIIASLGNLSKEHKSMLYSGYDVPSKQFNAGEGILLADSKDIIEVKYPLIEDEEDWKNHILQLL